MCLRVCEHVSLSVDERIGRYVWIVKNINKIRYVCYSFIDHTLIFLFFLKLSRTPDLSPSLTVSPHFFHSLSLSHSPSFSLSLCPSSISFVVFSKFVCTSLRPGAQNVIINYGDGTYLYDRFATGALC